MRSSLLFRMKDSRGLGGRFRGFVENAFRFPGRLTPLKQSMRLESTETGLRDFRI